MVIVKMWGGLGNQMFLYALYRTLQIKGKECKMDLSYFNYFNLHNGYEIERVFSVDGSYAKLEETERLANIKMDIIHRFIRKYIYTKKTHYIQEPYSDFEANKDVLEMDQVYLQGYFQSEKYFKSNKGIIRQEFSFKKPLDDCNMMLKEKIEKSDSVSIHVRRGDYLKAGTGLDGICKPEYYREAIEIIEKRIIDPHYFIFSDDMEWCRDNFRLSNCTFIDNNKEKDSYKDMQLMSCCKHNIIANSTFSWWGAWLNLYPSKMVIAPKEWNYVKRDDDIVPSSWIRC